MQAHRVSIHMQPDTQPPASVSTRSSHHVRTRAEIDQPEGCIMQPGDKTPACPLFQNTPTAADGSPLTFAESMGTLPIFSLLFLFLLFSLVFSLGYQTSGRYARNLVADFFPPVHDGVVMIMPATDSARCMANKKRNLPRPLRCENELCTVKSTHSLGKTTRRMGSIRT